MHAQRQLCSKRHMAVLWVSSRVVLACLISIQVLAVAHVRAVQRLQPCSYGPADRYRGKILWSYRMTATLIVQAAGVLLRMWPSVNSVSTCVRSSLVLRAAPSTVDAFLTLQGSIHREPTQEK